MLRGGTSLRVSQYTEYCSCEHDSSTLYRLNKKPGKLFKLRETLNDDYVKFHVGSLPVRHGAPVFITPEPKTKEINVNAPAYLLLALQQFQRALIICLKAFWMIW